MIIFELEEPILIGYSMGDIALLVASEVKTKALVLLDSAAEVVEYQDKDSSSNLLEEYLKDGIQKKNM